MHAGTVGRVAQMGARSAQDSLNRFVEGEGGGGGGYRQAPLDESKKDFWDDFSSLADQRNPQSSSIGTAAMGKGGTRGPAGPAGPAAAKKSQDEWDDW